MKRRSFALRCILRNPERAWDQVVRKYGLPMSWVAVYLDRNPPRGERP